MRTNYRRWSAYPYQGEQIPPKPFIEPAYYPMFFIFRGRNNYFLDPFQRQICWEIKNPNEIDWEQELFIVEQTLKYITPQQIRIAQYWGSVEATENMTPMIFNLAKKYRLGSPHLA